RHTRFDCDWSSDVCSSDLWDLAGRLAPPARSWTTLQKSPRKPELSAEHSKYASFPFPLFRRPGMLLRLGRIAHQVFERANQPGRSEERRVGKECRSQWSPY